jgi:AAA domain
MTDKETRISLSVLHAHPAPLLRETAKSGIRSRMEWSTPRRPALLPVGFVEPCLPSVRSTAPCGRDWGSQNQARRVPADRTTRGQARASSHGADSTGRGRFPWIEDALRSLRVQSATIDGEAVVLRAVVLPVQFQHVGLGVQLLEIGNLVALDMLGYPTQEMEVRWGDELKLKTEEKFGDVVQVNRAERSIDVRKGPKMAEVHPSSAFEHRYFNVEVIEDAIFAIGESFAGGSADRLAVRLLRADAPSTTSGTFENRPGETAVDFAVRVGSELSQSVLAIQGPPGAGKTFTGAQMICALVTQGKRVGIIATGHSVIHHLLEAVAEAAAKLGRNDVTLGHKVDEADADGSSILKFGNNRAALEALQSGEIKVLGGTVWLWSRSEFAKSVDVLFVDEAGQMSLANVLAVTQAAHSIVLLGDPQQLEQPKKGTHPEGVGLSALQHMLGSHVTVPLGRGIFLPETWRLSRDIATFTSEAFYEGRLRSKPGLERQQLVGNAFAGRALWAVDVKHECNRNASDEEVEAVDQLVTALLKSGSRWVDELGHEAQITSRDILVVAPFNAQVGRLAEKLAPRRVAVGTVDKFQGQEAPVVIYSMTASSPEDAPRGLEFLYSLNRLNVATSRARCAVFVVANPRLFSPDCKTPRQIKLANALCRYRELATIIPDSSR